MNKKPIDSLEFVGCLSSLDDDDDEQVIGIRHAVISGKTIVVVEGEVDIATAPALVSAIEAARHEPTAIVSLAAVRYIDCSGLGVLVREQLRRSKRGERLLVVLPPPGASRVFRLTGLLDVLECFDGLAEALSGSRSSSNGKSPSHGKARYDGAAANRPTMGGEPA